MNIHDAWRTTSKSNSESLKWRRLVCKLASDLQASSPSLDMRNAIRRFKNTGVVGTMWCLPYEMCSAEPSQEGDGRANMGRIMPRKR